MEPLATAPQAGPRPPLTVAQFREALALHVETDGFPVELSLARPPREVLIAVANLLTGGSSEVVVYDSTTLANVAAFTVIATCGSVEECADCAVALTGHLGERGHEARGTSEEEGWVLLDYGTFMINLMDASRRERSGIDRILRDLPHERPDIAEVLLTIAGWDAQPFAEAPSTITP